MQILTNLKLPDVYMPFVYLKSENKFERMNATFNTVYDSEVKRSVNANLARFITQFILNAKMG